MIILILILIILLFLSIYLCFYLINSNNECHKLILKLEVQLNNKEKRITYLEDRIEQFEDNDWLGEDQ